MAANKKPRKAYKPKPVITNPLAYVIESMTPIAEHESYLVDLKIKNNMAMSLLMRGMATKEDMNTLIAMHNIVEALCRMKFGQEYRDYLIRGKAALLDLCGRGKSSNKFICRAEEIQALNDLMELHDAQMDVATIKDLEKALAIATSDIVNKRATVIKDINK